MKETIQQLAERIGKTFQYKKFDNGIERVIVTADINSELWDEAHQIIDAVRDSEGLSDDSVYQFTSQALDIIADCDENATEDEIRDSIYESIEADVYTSSLTEWLNESNYHVWYLTEALQEFSPEDGIQLLSMAQQRAKESVASTVLDKLVEMAE